VKCASTGAAAALVAAAALSNLIDAIVSRGGRPDLGGDALPHVTAPTLLIVGGNDPVVFGLNRQALRSWEAKNAWKWCPAPITCLKSQELWRRLLVRQQSGFSAMSLARSMRRGWRRA